MRTIVAGAFMTLDGVVQDPGGFGETEHGGSAQRLFDDQAVDIDGATEQVLASDIFLLDRCTYELLQRAWSQNTGLYAEALHKICKVVVSNTLHGSLPCSLSTWTTGKVGVRVPPPAVRRHGLAVHPARLGTSGP